VTTEIHLYKYCFFRSTAVLVVWLFNLLKPTGYVMHQQV